MKNLTFGTMTGYVYGADGARVSTGTIATWGSCDPVANGYVATKDSIPGPSGGQLTETGVDANGNVVWAQYLDMAGGILLATYDPNGLHFYLNDWNGSRRVQTDYEGVVEQTCTNLPYGNGEICSPTPSEFLYGSLERDSESGLDHAMFRQYSSTFGILGGEVVGNPAFRVGSGFGGRDFLPSDGTASLAARATLRRKQYLSTFHR